MRLVWVVIPLVLFGIIGVQESFAEDEIIWENSVTVSNDKLIATLATDKKDYSDGEFIHIQWSLENVGTENIFYKRVGCPAQHHFDLEIFRSDNFSVNYNLGQLVPKDNISEPPCFEVEYGPPFIPPNGKIHNKLIWTQNLRSCDNIEKIYSGNHTLRITYYESEQQFYDDKPEYLELQINIQESFVKKDPIPPLHPDAFQIMVTDSEGNTLKSPEINKGHHIVFQKIGSNCKSTYEVTTSIECGVHKQSIYNTTTSITLPPNRTAIAFFIPTMAGPHHVTVSSEDWSPMTLDFSIPDKPQNRCDYDFISDLAPLKQIKNNVDSKDVICKDGLELIFKISDDSPICVKSETAEKLIQRGWANS